MGIRRKKEVTICSIAEHKILEDRFEKMASKGWLIDKLNLYSCEYKQIAPQELQFYIDILPPISAFDYPHNDSVEEYRRMCEESGWTFAAASKQTQVFFAKKNNCMPLPIHTDEKIKAQIMMKTCAKYEMLPFFISLLVLLPAMIVLFSKGYNIFLLNSTIAQALAFTIYVPFFLSYLCFLLAWYFKTMLYVKKDYPMPIVNYNLAKWRNLSFSISVIIIIAVVITGILLDISGGVPAVVFITVLIPLIGLAIGLSIRKQIDTKKRDKKTNIQIAVVGLIVMCIFSFVMTAIIISSLGSQTLGRQGLPKDRLALRLEDFGIETDIINNYFSTDTIAFPLNYTYYEISDNKSVRTDVKKSVNEILARKIFQDLYKKNSENQWRTVTEMTQDQLALWGAADGYYMNTKETEVLLLYEKTIVQASFESEGILIDDVQEMVKLIGSQ